MEEPLKSLYERELEHLEGHAREFAERQKYQKLAARLGLGETVAVRDPFVEWLLEGFAYLTARVQLKLDQEFPRFTQNLLAVVYPHLVAQTPSMLIARFAPDPDDASLLEGATVEKGARLRARVPGPERKFVNYVTGRSLRLWPLEVKAAEFLSDRSAVIARSERTVESAESRLEEEHRIATADGDAARRRRVESGLGFTLGLMQNGPLNECAAAELDVFLAGSPSVANALFEACVMQTARVDAVIRPKRRGQKARTIPLSVRPLGLDRDHRLAHWGDRVKAEADALLPYDRRSFDGFRLLHEFFALPERFQFIRIAGLDRAFAACEDAEIDIVFAFAAPFERLRGRVDAGALRLHCAPAVNLFSHEADDIRLSGAKVEHLVRPDMGQPTDYEVHTITRVVGHGEGDVRQEFRPFFSVAGFGVMDDGARRFYAAHREPREAPVSSTGDKRLKAYRGDETYLSIVDANAVPYSPRLKRLSVTALVTNRHLPIAVGGESASLVSDVDLPCTGIRIAAGPSLPRAGVSSGRRLWDMLSHLSLNYLSLIDTENGGGAEAMRALLSLYAPREDKAAQDLVGSLQGVAARTVPGRLRSDDSGDAPQPIVFGRGLEITLRLDERQERTPVLAAILERALASYAGVNSFTRLRLSTLDGQDRAAWPTRSGARPIL